MGITEKGGSSVGLEILVIVMIISGCVFGGPSKAIGPGRAGTGEDCSPSISCHVDGESCENDITLGKEICKNKVCADDQDCSTIRDTRCLADSQDSSKKSCQIPPPPPIQTPMVRYYGLGVQHGAPCRSVSAAILDIQTSDLNVDDKKKKLDTEAAAYPENFDYPVCNWKISRLHCVENRVQPPPPSASIPAGVDVYPLGTCQCLSELGEEAIWVPDSYKSKTSKTYGQCVIPANQGHASKCGHDIAIPTGQIDTGREIILTAGNSARMCAPGSECRKGYNYVGLQCSCKKNFAYVSAKKICKGDGDGKNGTPQTKITIMIFLFSLANGCSSIFGGVSLIKHV